MRNILHVTSFMFHVTRPPTPEVFRLCFGILWVLFSMSGFQERIDYEGSISVLLNKVCKDYGFSDYISHQVIPMGYEDFNIALKTKEEKYFVKIFASFRNEKNIKRYVSIIERVVEAGILHPKLYKASGRYLYEITIDGSAIRLVVMNYIKGQSFYETKGKLSNDEAKIIVQQAALINRIALKPALTYDSWSVVNFLKEYKKAKQYLSKEDDKLIAPVMEKFASVDLEKLPHTFVHGDIIKTNILKDISGRLFITDFSVANYYPRIQELAVILCNLLFDEENSHHSKEYYELAISEYQKQITLTSEELELLPLYIKAGHAMHVIGGTNHKSKKGNAPEENEYWINLGLTGLRQMA